MAPSPDGGLYGLIDAQRLKIRTLPPRGGVILASGGIYSGLFITAFVYSYLFNLICLL